VTGHNLVTYAHNSVAIFLIHVFVSKLSLQLSNAHQFCLSVHPSYALFPFGVPYMAGVKIWATKVKIAETITKCGCVTITDEGFTILALETYWDQWFHNKTAKWTDSRRGNQQFMG
jgi:hypothetical protein